MSVEDRHILGSAEPLSPEQTAVRLRELESWGVDLSLVQANLELTPTQRIEEMFRLLAFTDRLRRAWEEKRFYTEPEMTRTAKGDGMTPEIMDPERVFRLLSRYV